MSRLIAGSLLALFALVPLPVFSEKTSESQNRIAESLRKLSSDEMEGRGVGTDGLNKAADYLADEFMRMGLQTKVFGDSPFQTFDLVTRVELGAAENNQWRLEGPGPNGTLQTIDLRLGSEISPLAVGGSAQLSELPIVFAGYGITAREKLPGSEEIREYDDYAGLNVKGAVVIIIRREPQQADAQSMFNGSRPSRHAEFRTKVTNAYEHGAAAVLIVNDEFGLRQNILSDEKAWNDALEKLSKCQTEFRALGRASVEDTKKYRDEVARLTAEIQQISQRFSESGDQLVPFHGAGNESQHRQMPVLFCRRSVIEPLVTQHMGKDLTALEREIDATLVPQSKDFPGWKATGRTEIHVVSTEVKNVVGILEGNGALADQTVIVGAHYDHLGLGEGGSLAPWTKEIHNGADDNGSGTAAMLDVARRFAAAAKVPRRRMVFIGFTAEERGLLGSRHFVRQPPFALESVVAMLNLDMVGRLTDDKLVVFGTGTALEFDGMVEALNKKYDFFLEKQATGHGPSDHASFVEQNIPVFHFFTGVHDQYHRPSDDFELLNVAGVDRITSFVSELAEIIATADKPPTFQQVDGAARIGRVGR